MHGGNVRGHSEGPGKGSEFVVRLPLAASPIPARRTEPEPRPSSVLAARRVLVVDDNRDAAESLGMLLKLLGADVHVVYNGPVPWRMMVSAGCGASGHRHAEYGRPRSGTADPTTS